MAFHTVERNAPFVLSIGKLGQGQADYYLQSVAQGIEDYYAGEGEATGQWLGAAADELDVFGQVEGELLHRALSGKHPQTGARLARPPRGAIRVTGFDLTFSAPKSVSLLFGLGDADISAQVRDAHETAVRAALGYMERHAAVGRRGRGGTQSVLGNGFLGAAFRHRTSRAGDPQLHTHVLVANMTRGPDGRWTALDARRLYAHAKTGGYLYQAQLRAELTTRLGLEWTPVRRGVADLAGIPPAILRAFSRRRHEIEQRMADRGESSAKAAQVATLDTRQAKQYGVDAPTLIDRWRDRARELGFDPATLRDLPGRTQLHHRTPEADRATSDELASPTGLTERRSTFVRRDVVQAWCEALPQGGDVAEIEALADGFMASERAVPLAADISHLTGADVIRRADGRIVTATTEERPHSTPELLALERAIIGGALSRAGERTATVAEATVEAALAARPSLADEQRDMVRALTTGGAGVAVVVGKAGTGKTYALDAARAAWQAEGYVVLGAALARRAARELQDGSGIESTSVAALLQDLRDGFERGLLGNGRTVLVVDEAGMVGTRQLAELLDHTAHARAKVVLVGDDRQLPEIDAGGAFRGLLTRMAPIELMHNRRQEEAWERDALDLLRAGRADDAMGHYERHGRVVVADSASSIHDRLVADWWAVAQGGQEAVMVAARRDDVAMLNAAARTLMAADDRLDGQALVVGSRSFSAGDHVVCLQNARRFGVLNGTRGTITAVDATQQSLELRTTDGHDLHLPAQYLDARTARGTATLDYGYAITGHKAQGMTTGYAFVLGTEETYREWGYVALSRGRVQNRLYVVAPEPPERDEIAPPEPRPEPLQAITDALRRSRSQHLAVDLAEQHALAALPTDQLRDEQQRLRDLVPTTRMVDRLRRRLLDLGDQRGAAEQAAAQASGAPAAQASQRARELAATEHELRDRLDGLATPSTTADAARLAAVEAQLHARREGIVRAALLDPAPYLIAELGPLPARPMERQAWRRAARRIEGYRYDHALVDPVNALGAEPGPPADRAAWQTCRRSVEAYIRRDDLKRPGREHGRAVG